MATNDKYELQVSLKTPRGGLINIPADSTGELVTKLAQIRESAEDILATEQILFGVQAVVSGFANGAESQPAPTQAASPPSEPAFAPSQSTATGAPPTCPHGTRVYKDGSATGATWAAYMCPTPKGTPGQCKPIDFKTGKEWGAR